VDAHEFAAVFAAPQRKFGAGKRFNQRFPNYDSSILQNSHVSCEGAGDMTFYERRT
jgi:hypothetical protein